MLISLRRQAATLPTGVDGRNAVAPVTPMPQQMVPVKVSYAKAFPAIWAALIPLHLRCNKAPWSKRINTSGYFLDYAFVNTKETGMLTPIGSLYVDMAYDNLQFYGYIVHFQHLNDGDNAKFIQRVTGELIKVGSKKINKIVSNNPDATSIKHLDMYSKLPDRLWVKFGDRLETIYEDYMEFIGLHYHGIDLSQVHLLQVVWGESHLKTYTPEDFELERPRSKRKGMGRPMQPWPEGDEEQGMQHGQQQPEEYENNQQEDHVQQHTPADHHPRNQEAHGDEYDGETGYDGGDGEYDQPGHANMTYGRSNVDYEENAELEEELGSDYHGNAQGTPGMMDINRSHKDTGVASSGAVQAALQRSDDAEQAAFEPSASLNHNSQTTTPGTVSAHGRQGGIASRKRQLLSGDQDVGEKTTVAASKRRFVPTMQPSHANKVSNKTSVARDSRPTLAPLSTNHQQTGRIPRAASQGVAEAVARAAADGRLKLAGQAAKENKGMSLLCM